MKNQKSFLEKLHHYFLPHEGNEYRPHVFRKTSVISILIAVLVIQSLYIMQLNFVFKRTDFLGAVLPGALVALTNNDRAVNDVPTVAQNDLLSQAAQDAANDMSAKGYFAHVSPDGKDPWYWLNLVGYKYQYAGENLAVNFTDSSDVENAWMASPTHRANIVKPQYTQIGIGVANGIYQGKEVTFVVQFFATPETQVEQPTTKVAAAPAEVTESTTSVQSNVNTITSTSAPKVLGTETVSVSDQGAEALSSSITNFFALVTTSPTHTITYILMGLAIAVAILLIVAITVKFKKQYIEIIAGGLIILVIIIGLLIMNIKSAPKVEIASGNNAVATGK